MLRRSPPTTQRTTASTSSRAISRPSTPGTRLVSPSSMIVLVTRGMKEVMTSIVTPSANATATRRQ